MKIKENYDLRKIKIPKQFLITVPSEKKIIDKRNNIINDPNGIYIVMNYKRQLLDGYASYLAAGSLGIDRLNVRQLNIVEEKDYTNKGKMLFVYGHHPHSENIYMWRITKHKEETIGKIKKGDVLMANTKFGPAPIIVTRVKRYTYSPSLKKIKTIIGRIENK